MEKLLRGKGKLFLPIFLQMYENPARSKKHSEKCYFMAKKSIFRNFEIGKRGRYFKALPTKMTTGLYTK